MTSGQLYTVFKNWENEKPQKSNSEIHLICFRTDRSLGWQKSFQHVVQPNHLVKKTPLEHLLNIQTQIPHNTLKVLTNAFSQEVIISAVINYVYSIVVGNILRRYEAK